MTSERINFAALLLLLCVMRHYGWTLAPESLAGVASKGIGAIVILSLLATLRPVFANGLTWCIAGWWACNEIMVAGCSGAWMIRPWAVRTGYPMCSEWIGVDLGLIAAVFVAVIALTVSLYSGRVSKGSQNERTAASNYHR